MTAIPLVCPGCRTFTPERLDVRTVERDGNLYLCACGRRYPIVDGVPILLHDPTAFVRDNLGVIVERDLPVEVAALLAQSGSDDDTYPHILDHLSIYLDAHWSKPPCPPVIARLAALDPVATCVELGCSVGGFLPTLAARARAVLGIDLQFASVRRARRLLAGESLVYNRRLIGRHYEPIEIAARPAVPNATVVCGDVLDPPLVPKSFDRVVALNVLDSVPEPRRLLDVIDLLLAPGGELVLTSPYAWQSSVVAEHLRIGEADPAGALIDQLRATGYDILASCDLDWTLRRDARCSLTYCIHYVHARKV